MKVLLVSILALAVLVAAKPAPITSLPGLNFSVPYEMYAGYIPVQEKSYFYYFVTSQNDSANDPVVLWLNGGPGCSSLGGGLLSENGPIHPSHNQTLNSNPYAWNQIANVLYLESPAGVGFSLNPNGEQFNDNKTAEDNYQFLLNWFVEFSEFADNEFWVTGESYGGVYVPMLGELIMKNQDSSPNATRLAQNFQGIMVGNPYVNNDDNSDVEYYKYHALTDLQGRGGDGPGTFNLYDILVDNDPCSAILLSEYVRFPVNDRVSSLLQDFKHGKQRRYVPNPSPCINSYVTKYLNLEDVKEAIGANTKVHWELCGGPFYEQGSFSTVSIYKELVIKYNRKVLVYSGDADTVCNFIGTERWAAQLGLSPEQSWRSWVYKRPSLPKNQEFPQIGGFGVNYKEGFTYITVKGAGHMVPWFQPGPAYEFFMQFLRYGRINFDKYIP